MHTEPTDTPEVTDAPSPDRAPATDEPRGWRRRPSATTVLAFLFYLGFAVWLTWPLAADLDTRLYGAVGDLTGAISTFRELVEQGQLPFAPGDLDDLAAPDGLDVSWALNLSSWASVSVWFLLTAVFGPLAAAGIYTIAGFTLSGFAMFLLARKLTGSAAAALVAGFAYGFYPFVVVKAQGHVDFIHGWVLVVLLWRAIELAQAPTRRNVVFAGLALILACSWTPYHVLFAAAVVIGVAVAAVVLARGRRWPVLRGFAVTSLIGLVWLGVLLAASTLASGEGGLREHRIEAAYTYSARVLEYVVPSDRNVLVGDDAGEWRNTHLHGSNRSESTLYVGITVLLLALAGVFVGVRRRGRWGLLAASGAGVAAAGFILSAPPKVNILGHGITTPTGLLFDLTSTWRVFSRMVVVVELGLVVLAAIGLAALLRGRRLAVVAPITLVLLVLIGADLRTAPPDGTNLIRAPETYRQLAKLGPGIAAEYPLLPAEQSQYGDVFYQAWYDKPLLNGYRADSPEETRALGLADLGSRDTARGLAALGVRWVMVRRDTAIAGLPTPARVTKDYTLRGDDGYLGLYELRVPGTPVLVSPWTGFLRPDPSPRGPLSWLTEPEGEIDIRGTRCSPCSGTVSFDVMSLGAVPRTVTVTDEDGRVLAREQVTNGRIRFPLRFTRHARLNITASPGARQISKVLGGPDERVVSIGLTRPRFTPEGRP